MKWLEREEPDLLALQETKLRDEDFPADTFADHGYTATFSGQPSYNGIAILSREAAADPRVKVLSFTRNFGQQAAITAGIDFASGDAARILSGHKKATGEILKKK